MLRIASIAVAVVAAAVLSATSQAGRTDDRDAFPQVIQLPTGFQPEGLEIGRGTTFYVGSVANGAIFRGDLRTGNGAVLVPGAAGRSATGIELDSRGRLFVAGAATGTLSVYDARSGDLLRTYTLATAPTFINDLVVTRDAVYVTDSQNPVLYKIPLGAHGTLGPAQTIALSGDYVHVPNAFNLNGIDATPSGKTLVAVQSVNGRLYRIDPTTGAATAVSLGGESVPNGDGILLDGKTLYVVQNQNDVVAVIDLSRDLGTGTVRTRLTDPDFDVPTTMDELGHRLYAVNARFGVDDAGHASYQVVQFRKAPGPHRR